MKKPDITTLNQDFNLPRLLKFTFPSVFLMVFLSIYTMVDGYFVSNYVSENAFSSINIVFPCTSLIIAIGTMLGAGGCAILTRSMGENDFVSARKNLSLITLTAVIIGGIITVVGYFNAEELSIFLRATDILLEDCVKYIRIMFIFSIMLILQILSHMLFVADGKPGLGLIVSIVGGLINIVLDYIFIARIGMGIEGAAIATGIGYCIPAIAYLLYFSLKRNSGLYFTKPSFNLRVLARTCFNGSSEMVTNLASTITTFLFNVIILKYLGETGVAAVGIILYAQFLFQSLFVGYARGVAPIIGYNYGSQNRDRLKKVIKLSFFINIVASAIIYCLVMLIKSPLVEMFFDKQSPTFDITVGGMTLFAFSFLFQGINIFSSSMFTSFSDGIRSAVISFVRTFLFIVVFILVLPLVLKVNGVWLAIPFAEAFGLIVSLTFVIKGRKIYHY